MYPSIRVSLRARGQRMGGKKGIDWMEMNYHSRCIGIRRRRLQIHNVSLEQS